jgi:hypothetical protein
VLFWREIGYFDASAVSKLFCIPGRWREEQFYPLWPAAIVGAARPATIGLQRSSHVGVASPVGAEFYRR